MSLDNPTGFPLDPRWSAVAEETFRRPPIPMRAPGAAMHYVLHTDTAEADAHRAHMRRLFEQLNLILELDASDQQIASNETLLVKWERHTEFCSISLFSRAAEPVADLESWPRLDAGWRAQTPGRLVLAMKIAIEPRDRPWVEEGFVPRYGNPTRVKSAVNGGEASLETSFQPGPDGCVHALIVAADMPADALGRLVQRVIEIETYRVLTLYSWPDVQAVGPRLNEIDRGVARLTERLTELRSGEDSVVLEELTRLARELETISAQTHFRFNASTAYYDLVQRRIEELRESRIDGEQRVSDLINRRLSPAARTYRSILTRQAEMSERVSRTSQLLRSRIDVELAQQNQALLASVDRRARQQYMLQLTVEGLSTVAISYYALGILSYALGALSGVTHDVDPKLVVGILAPFVVVAVYFGLRQWRLGMHKDEH